jgi:hypothetical protein
MIKPNKWMSKLILTMILLLHGCAVQTPLFDTEPERAGFVITKPPVQISYRGDISPESQAFALDVLKEMQKFPYKDYKFNENHNVRLNTIDAKTDKADINLHESTSSGIPKVPDVVENGGME